MVVRLPILAAATIRIMSTDQVVGMSLFRTEITSIILSMDTSIIRMVIIAMTTVQSLWLARRLASRLNDIGRNHPARLSSRLNADVAVR